MEEKGAHPFRSNDNGIDENGKPITNYQDKYQMTNEAFEKMKTKYNFGVKDYVQPNSDAEKEFVLDQLIAQMLEAKKGKWGKPVQLEQKAIKFLIDEAAKIFMSEKLLLDLEAPIKVVGDVHGQFFDLFRLFDVAGFPSTNQKFLFIGDYVDRGKQSIETICLLLAFKIKYPNTFFMLRGNHECQSINRMYGFYDECKRRYNLKTYREFELVFNVLPISAVIDDRILCMHGGLSPDLQDLENINYQPRPFEVPDEGIMCDLVWSDPEIEVQGWAPSDRGVSFVFGQDVVKKFNKKHQLNLICRAHQVVEDGYEFMANRGIVTIFSAPNYCGEFDNNAGILNVDETLCCSFDILKPVERKTLMKLQKEGNRSKFIKENNKY